MKSILIKQAKIVDINSPFNGQLKDLRIENELITAIDNLLEPNENDVVYSGENWHISTGWVDLSAQLGEPGFEFKEDIDSALAAAAKGGFTQITSKANSHPVADNKGIINYLIRKAENSLVQIKPSACLSEGGEGKNLAELFDLHQNGAAYFSDGKVQNDTGILNKALLYTQQFDGLICSYPNSKHLNAGGQVNESLNSCLTGLKGMPAIAESMQLQRDLNLVEYTGGKMHFTCISTEKSVELIAEAKKKGLKITCDIAAHQIAYDDSVVNSFDTNYKIFPPFRTRKDVAALLQGLINGTIDAVCSDHTPEDVENKNLEFDLAAFGIIGFQTAFAVINTQLKKHLPIALIVEKFTNKPRQILSQDIPSIQVGQKAELTLFNPDLVWTLSEEELLSKSKNTPFIGEQFIGKALGIVNKGQISVFN